MKQNEEFKTENQVLAVLKRMSKNKAAVVGLIVFIILVLIAILSPWIEPYSHTQINIIDAYALPSLKHVFGCDDLGRDIMSRLMYGARYSLAIGVVSVIFSAIVGVFIGSVAGYFGKKVDLIIMRIVDVISCIPGLLMAVVISAVLGNGFDKTVLALSVSSIPQYVRLIRASIMSIRDMEYLEAAESINCTTYRTIMKHVLPNSFSSIIVTATMGVAGTIMMAAGLSYIGLGVQPPMPEWGAMLSGARNYIRDYPHMVVFPGIAIAITVLSLNMLGDGLRDALDPKLKR